MTNPVHRTATAVLAALLAAGALGACGDDAGSGSGSASKTEYGNAVTISGVDYGYVLDQQKVKAGRTKITFENDGKDIHMLALAQLKPGVTFDAAKKAIESDDDADDEAAFVDTDGPANAPQILTPGQSTTTYPELNAGTYAMVCFFPVAGAPAAAGGPPPLHYERGMLNQLTVETEATTETVETGGEIVLADGKITLPDLSKGEGTFKVSNTGKEGHDLTIVRPADGKTFDDLIGFIDGFFQGEGSIADMPGALAGGSAVIPAGGTGYLTLDLAPGKYYAICTESATDEDSSEHFRSAAGEKVEFTVS